MIVFESEAVYNIAIFLTGGASYGKEIKEIIDSRSFIQLEACIGHNGYEAEDCQSHRDSDNQTRQKKQARQIIRH